MKSEEKVREKLEELKYLSWLKWKTEPSLIYMIQALEWVLEDEEEKDQGGEIHCGEKVERKKIK